MYNILNNFCVLNNSKEDISVLVIVDNQLNYNIDDSKHYTVIDKKNIDKIKLKDYTTLINLSNDKINTITKEFLKVNSHKSYNFIVDKNKDRLDEINKMFGIKDFFAFKSCNLDLLR